MTASGKNMNCEEYKEAIAAEPSATFEGAEHAAGCTDCAAFQASACSRPPPPMTRIFISDGSDACR